MKSLGHWSWQDEERPFRGLEYKAQEGTVPGGDRDFYPRERVVPFLLLGPAPLFEEGLLAHPHPNLGNEIKIVPEIGGV